jgi:hypothetical protein
MQYILYGIFLGDILRHFFFNNIFGYYTENMVSFLIFVGVFVAWSFVCYLARSPRNVVISKWTQNDIWHWNNNVYYNA